MSDTTTYPPTKAQRHLADNEAAMRTAIETLRATLEDQAAQMTKAQLVEAITGNRAGVKAPTASAAKALWEGAWVEVQVRTSGQQKALNRARQEVTEEQQADRAVQRLLEAADELVQGLRDELAKPGASIHALAYWQAWNAEDVAVAATTAALASQWHAARMRGVEPHELANEMIKGVFRTLTMGHSGSNLRVSGHGIEELAKSEGATRFLRALSPVAPEWAPYLF